MQPAEMSRLNIEVRTRFLDEKAEQRGDTRTGRSHDHGGVEAAGLEHGLTENGSRRQAPVKSKREVADGLASSLVGSKIVDDARRPHIEGRLTEPRDQPQPYEHRKRFGQSQSRGRQRNDPGPRDD
jgi:hypothetical protein